MCFYPRKTTTFGNIHNYIGLVVPKAVFGHILSYMLHAVPNRESNPLLTERKVLLYENWYFTLSDHIIAAYTSIKAVTAAHTPLLLM